MRREGQSDIQRLQKLWNYQKEGVFDWDFACDFCLFTMNSGIFHSLKGRYKLRGAPLNFPVLGSRR